MLIEVFALRIFVCFIISLIIGMERQFRHKMVGLRTVVLVSLGAFMFNYVSYSFNIADKTRIAAQIVSGIGFLGAGVIIRDGNKIKGLNTAATLWCVAAIGVLTSCGLLIESIVCCLLILIDNVFLRIISNKIMKRLEQKQEEVCSIKIKCRIENEETIRNALSKNIEKNRLNLISFDKTETLKDEIKIKCEIVTLNPNLIEQLVNILYVLPGVISISWNHVKLYDNIENNDEE